jgi:hypothetical protein
MQCGFHSDAGKEADDLSITWHDAGTDLLVDAGRYRGDDPAFRDYSMSTRAHNTIEVDGHDHHADRPKYRSALRSSGTLDGIHYGSARAKLGDVVARRALVYAPGAWLLVFDTLRDNAAAGRTYRQWFHAAPDIEVDVTDERVLMTTDDGRSIHVTPLLHAGSLSPQRGGLEPRPQGWHSPGADVVIPNWAFGWQTSSDDIGRFATLFTLGDPAVVLKAEPGRGANKARFAWQSSGGVVEVAIDLRKEDPVTLSSSLRP